ncbi:VanZ family protein [Nocardioides mangrovicus]|uniref:VanZ family protein n=1 Tax=Nocardioides mangrovicus TaxID=2478913 RepID=UPI001314E42E|nr:VanZ family protein [Nocardioides mangrovicus]
MRAAADPLLRRVAWAIAALYAVGLALLVFSPIGGALNELTVRLYVLWVYRLHGNPAVTPDWFGAGLNVVLFVPLGVLVVLLVRWPWWAATLLAVWVSAGIELVQVIPVLHRVASLEDVITNTTGGFAGALIGIRLRDSVRARDIG